MSEGLVTVAEQLARSLSKCGKRVVLAESCTCGLAAATLAGVPGISRWLCGSAVTYREQTKIEWLGVPGKEIERYSVVSGPVAQAMAHGVLARTSEADVSAAITGHLGPDAPREFDGVVYIATASRRGSEITTRVWGEQLEASHRHARQQEAAKRLLARLESTIVRLNNEDAV